MSNIRRYTLKPPVPARKYKVAYEQELNSEQLAVVMAEDGPMLVIAGAGSGKTRTLTYRVSRVIEDGVDPSDILLLTFTNKASREMLSRVEQLVTVDTRRIWGGTFHSVANRLLRRHAETLGYRNNFSILDEEDAKEMMESAISATGIDTLAKRFPKGDVLLDVHSTLINTGVAAELYIEQNFPYFAQYLTEIYQVFARYASRKREANVMDFDDLLLNWKRLLVEKPEISEALKRKFRHVLVDEYQDTNKLQADIVDMMASVKRNVMVVGDDAQSIYSFRGASFENILTFPNRFPDARIYKLETNYRSTPEILTVANSAIRNNRFQFQKELRATRASGPSPALVGVDDVFQQAAFVAQRILELRDEGEKLGDIAVLYRSHYQSLELQMELARRNIPYEIRSGVRFFEQAHVKDVLAYLKIVTNSRDELSWKRTMKLYPKIGEKIAAEVWQRISTSGGDPLHNFIRGGGTEGQRAVSASMASLRHLLEVIANDSMKRNPAESIRYIVEQSYGEYARAKFPNASARLDDLEQLSQYAMSYADVEEFLSELALSNPISGEDAAVVGPEDEKIVLSSVHQSKGLEWRIVFIIWLSDGRFPSARALKTSSTVRLPEGASHETLALPPALATEPQLASAEAAAVIPELVIPGEEEERRLFYVAVTRARQELYLVFPILARDRMQMDILMEPSRFLKEIPAEMVEKWVIE